MNVCSPGCYPFGLIEEPGADVLPPGANGRFAVTATADDVHAHRALPLRDLAPTAPPSTRAWMGCARRSDVAASEPGADPCDAEDGRFKAFLCVTAGTMQHAATRVLPPEAATTPRPEGKLR